MGAPTTLGPTDGIRCPTPVVVAFEVHVCMDGQGDGDLGRQPWPGRARVGRWCRLRPGDRSVAAHQRCTAGGTVRAQRRVDGLGDDFVGRFGPGSGHPPIFGAAYNPSRRQWRTIASPVPDMAGSTVLWTGDGLLVWARRSKSAQYNPTTDRWAAIPALRLRPREEMAAVWTGSEAIVWGGTGPSGSPLFADGAAWTLTGRR